MVRGWCYRQGYPLWWEGVTIGKGIPYDEKVLILAKASHTVRGCNYWQKGVTIGKD